MSGDPGQEMVKALAAGGVGGFVEKVAPAWIEAGAWSADVIRWFRFKTAIKIFKRAEAMCEAAGIEPTAVAWKTLVPLLENASLEEDPEEAEDPEGAEAMHERWSALVANAAAGDAGAHVHPGFARILAELTPTEAAMLDWLVGQQWRASVDSLLQVAGVQPQDWTGPSPRRHGAEALLDNLQRLALCHVYLADDSAHRPYRSLLGARVEITRLGTAFVAACTPPSHSEPSSEE